MDRSPALLAALLGIWKAGAAYLPLDPALPPERLRSVLQDAEPRFVLAEKRYAPLLSAHAPRVLCASCIATQRTRASCPDIALSADSLAYVLYTSGSTGKPKGVEVCHGGLANVVTALAEQLQLRPGEVLLAHSSLGFDVSNLEMYLPLVSGGSVHLAENGCAGDGKRLIRALHQSGAATMLGTATLWRLMLDAGWEGKPDLRVISGGEVLSPELAQALADRSAALWNQYGPSEGTICATTSRIDSPADRVTIGRPLRNVTVRVLDSRLQPVAAGIPGELYIGGAGVARGYRNRPSLTAASFFVDPFSPGSGARLYKTGDLARELPDGRLEFLGRADNQVKIRGYRVELEEIEEHIRQYPGVDAAALSPLETEHGGPRLVAWVISKRPISPAAIREFLKKRLPAYMLPAEFRRLDALPLNQNGKIDRRSLNAGRGVTTAIPAAASTPEDQLGNHVESRLKSIWEDLLNSKPIALTDSFFDLGGDSFLAASLVRQIETHFDRKMSPGVLIECPDIKSLAARIALDPQNTAWRALAPLRVGGTLPPFFLVYGLGGSALHFRRLPAHLREDRPVYGLALPSGVVHDRSEVDIKALAAKYIDEIRSLFPAGPYHLGGHSFGGLIAFEMALQLTRAGGPAGLLALLDSDRNIGRPVNGARADRESPALFLRHCKAKVESLMEKGVAEVIRRRVGHIRLQDRVKSAEKAVRNGVSEHTFEADELLVLAAARYDPPPYEGNAVLFRARDEVRADAGDAMGWAGIVRGRLEIADIPGKHLTLFDEPHVAQLGAELEARMT